MNNYPQLMNAGDIVLRPKTLGFIEHVGVAVAPNLVLLHNSPGMGEHLGTVDEFAAGQPVRVIRTATDPAAVKTRSQKILANPRQYDPIIRNCQHTANEIIYGIARSPLVVVGLIVATVILIYLVVARR